MKNFLASNHVVVVCGKGARKKGGAPRTGFIDEARRVLSGLKSAGRLKGVTVEAVSMAGTRRLPRGVASSQGPVVINGGPSFIIVKSGNRGMPPHGRHGRKTVVINGLTHGLLEKAIWAVTSGEAWLGGTNPDRESAWSKALQGRRSIPPSR